MVRSMTLKLSGSGHLVQIVLRKKTHKNEKEAKEYN